MRFPRAAASMFFILSFLTPCFAHHMAVVVNKENNVGNMSAAQLGKILRSELKKWPDGKGVIVILHSDSAGETETLEHLIKMSSAEVKALVAAHKDTMVVVDSDSDVLKAVRSTPGAIGLVELHSVDNSVTVVRVDGKLPMESGYLPH
ncbi:MAG TPA: substrate-binding domain-containing protein [Candidatus Binatia bacterium]|nr:substrate-binding domain-containing protein [Candidatus Binatia bacterium]